MGFLDAAIAAMPAPADPFGLGAASAPPPYNPAMPPPSVNPALTGTPPITDSLGFPMTAATTPPAPVPTKPGVPPAPGAPPSNTAATLAQGQQLAPTVYQQRDDALAQLKAFQPYQEQQTEFTPPKEEKANPWESAINLVGAAFLRKSNPGAVLSLNATEQAQTKQRAEDYERRYGEARDAYAEAVNEQNRLAQNSDKREALLDKNVDVADKAVAAYEANLERSRKDERAHQIAQQRADAYGRSIIDRYQNDLGNRQLRAAQIAENARYHAQQIGVRYSALNNALEEQRMRDAVSLHNNAMTTSTALQVADRRNNVALALQHLKDLQQDKTVARTEQFQAAWRSAQMLNSQYSTIIRAASGVGASPAAVAAAAALVAPSADGKPSPYDQLTQQMKQLGVNLGPGKDTQDIEAQQQQYYRDAEVDAYGAQTGAGLPQGGITINVNPGAGAAAASSPPAASTTPGGTTGAVSAAPTPAAYARMVSAAAQKYNVPPSLLSGIFSTESSWNPNAKNQQSGATGLAQFMPATAAELGIDPNNPAQAIDGASRYMASLLKQFNGDTFKAIAAYHRGPGAVAAGGPMTPDDLDYYNKVMGGGNGAVASPQAATTPPQPANPQPVRYPAKPGARPGGAPPQQAQQGGEVGLARAAIATFNGNPRAISGVVDAFAQKHGIDHATAAFQLGVGPNPADQTKPQIPRGVDPAQLRAELGMQPQPQPTSLRRPAATPGINLNPLAPASPAQRPQPQRSPQTFAASAIQQAGVAAMRDPQFANKLAAQIMQAFPGTSQQAAAQLAAASLRMATAQSRLPQMSMPAVQTPPNPQLAGP